MGQGFPKQYRGRKKQTAQELEEAEELTVYLNVSSKKRERGRESEGESCKKKKSIARFFVGFFFVVVLVFFGLILHDHCKLAIKKSFSVICEKKVPLFNKNQ